jgi:RNA polymerase sigma-70 factor (ECF subfamily)
VDAVRALLEQYVPHVYRFALRLAGDPHRAEDLTQETFLRAWRSRRRLRDPEAARVWLFKIAVNLWRDQARRAGRAPKQVEAPGDDCDGLPLPPERGGSPENGLIDREDLARALSAMEGLPERQRQVLYLHACEGLNLGQIADVLRMSTDAAKASLSLARKAMRRRLKDLCRDRFPSG